LACNFGARLGVGDLAPFVRRFEIEAVAVGEAEEGGSAPFGVTCAAFPGDFYEAERDQFADGGCDCVAVDSVFDELVEGDWQSAVVLAAVRLGFCRRRLGM
jgi:hypothetical protein